MIKQSSEQNDVELEILDIVRSLLLESGANRAASLLKPGSSFERDLGLGSLERVELLLRVETAFSVSFPDATIAEVQTPQELAKIVVHAAPSSVKRSYERVPTLKGNVLPTRSTRTLCDALILQTEANPDRPHIYLPSESGKERVITYEDLTKSATAVAQGLLSRGLVRGETVAIMLPTDRTFFYVFFGVLFAGGIPVPVYPPFRPDRIEEYARRQTGILQNAGVVFLITFQKVERLAQLLKPRISSLRAVFTADTLLRQDRDIRHTIDLPMVSREGDPALIQYTSGSTGDPKGVVLTHRNLIANIKSVGQAMAVVPEDAGVSWLPLYHDMGLIGAWLLPLYYGIPVTILPPFSFLSRPERWLWAIHTHRGTISPAPNFAYEICARKIKDEDIEGLDLSAWRIAMNGAEPINPETLIRFTKRFAPYGFRQKALLPVYGMAEASVGLSFPKLGSGPRVDRVSRDRFERDRVAMSAMPSESSPLEFVSCGLPLPGHEIRIVDEIGKPVGERIEGHLVFRGPSCTSGYYRNPEATKTLFQDGWLISGDLGYWADGELFITGRKKDLIIKGGRNLHPHEIENVVGEIPGIRKGCIAAFGVPDKVLGTERLVIVAETRETQDAARSELNTTINKVLIETIGIPPDFVSLIAPGSIPKTSSGKITRSACRAAYLKGSLAKHRRTEWQFVRLITSSFWMWFRRGLKETSRFFYGVYLAFLLVPIVIPLWGIMPFFSGNRASQLLRKAARCFLKLAGVFPKMLGEVQFEKKGPVVWVANHASYVDALLLIAVLPAGVRFVAKQELMKVPILKTFLHKGQHLTVDRTDVTKGISKAGEIESVLHQGGMILIFPEATFFPTAGLRDFKLGAFKAAVATGSPICPISMEGSRQLLRDGRWLPYPRRVSITIGKTILPKEDDWREMVRLRDLSREEIALHCGEAMLTR